MAFIKISAFKRAPRATKEIDLAGVLNGANTKISIGQIIPLIASDVKDEIQITGQALEPTDGGELPTPPEGQIRYMDVTGAGVWTHPSIQAGENNQAGRFELEEYFEAKFWYNGNRWLLRNFKNNSTDTLIRPSDNIEVFKRFQTTTVEGKSFIYRAKLDTVNSPIEKPEDWEIIGGQEIVLDQAGGAASYENVQSLAEEVGSISSFIGEATEAKIDIPISSFTRVQGKLIKTDGNVEDDTDMSYLQLNVSTYSTLEFSGRIMTWLSQDSVNARARAYLYDPFSPLFITAIPSRLGADTDDRETVLLDVSRFTLLTINVKNSRFVGDDLKLSTFQGDSLEARIKAVISPPASPQSVAPIPNQAGVIDASGNVGSDPNSRWSGYIPVPSGVDYIYYGADKAFYGAFYNAAQEPIRAFINYPYSFHETVEGAAYFGVNTANQQGSIDYPNSRIGFIPKLFQGFVSQQQLQEAVRMAKHTKTAEWVGEFIVDVGRDFVNGATPQARIQQALDFAEGRKVTVYLGENYQLSSKTWNIESSLLIGNNTALIIGEGVRIKFAKNEVVDTIIRSKNIQTIAGAALHSRAYMEGLLRADEIENVVVLGSGIDKTFIEGSDIPYSAPIEAGGASIPWIGDPFGWRTLSVLLVNVKNVEAGGYALTKTKCWGTLFEHCTNFYGHDIKIDSAVGTNGDGCNALGGSTFGVIERISGTTGDDTVFVGNINRAPENYPAPRHSFPPYQYSMLVMHNINREQPTSFQDVHDVIVNDISGNSWGKQVRIMATNGSKVSKIKVNKVYQTNGPNAGGQGTVAIELNYDQHSDGIADDILLNNIKADIARGSTVQISSGATNVVANNIRGDGNNPAVSGGAPDTILTNIFPA